MPITEVVSGMKISNWCVIAGILMVVFSLRWGIKYQFLWMTSYTRFSYNQLADNAIEDGLQAGIMECTSTEVVIDEEAAVQGLKNSLLKGFGLTEDSLDGQRLLDCVACIVILQEESFSVITKDGKEYYQYPCEKGHWDSNLISQCVEEKVESVLTKQVGFQEYLIDFPSVREEWCHTLDGVGMLCFMRYQSYNIDSMSYRRFIVSGARVTEEE